MGCDTEVDDSQSGSELSWKVEEVTHPSTSIVFV